MGIDADKILIQPPNMNNPNWEWMGMGSEKH